MYGINTNKKLPMTLLACTAALLLAACGGGGGGSSGTASNPPPGGTVEQPVPLPVTDLQLVAGTIYPGGIGLRDGSGPAARFSYTGGMNFDAAGNLFIADPRNRSVRKLAADGRVTTASSMLRSIDAPGGIAFDSKGNMFIAADGAILRVGTDGVFSSFAGAGKNTGPARDGKGADARFNSLDDMTVDAAGNLYVIDGWMIRKVTPDAQVTTILNAQVPFNCTNPMGLAADAAGNVYYTANGSAQICRLSTSGVVTVFAGGTGGYRSMRDIDGSAAEARFYDPRGLAFDSAGNLYVANMANVRKVTPSGVVSTIAGVPGDAKIVRVTKDGRGDEAGFLAARRIAVDSAGNIYIGDSPDSYNLPAYPTSTIRKIDASANVTTVAGTAEPGTGSLDGAATAARFKNPGAAVADSAGNIYVVDTDNVTIRRIGIDGTVITLAGSAGQRGYADGSGADALFFRPVAITIDSAGTLYVADQGNGAVRKLTQAGVVTTLAGNPAVNGPAKDGLGKEATFSSLAGIAMGADGNLYVADAGAVRKVTPEGRVSIVAGDYSARGDVDGSGAAARFQRLHAIAAGKDGSLYVAEGYQSNGVSSSPGARVRKIAADGRVTTLAGMIGEEGSRDGVGSAARFGSNLPGIAVDAQGLVYVADNDNHLIRRITPGGTVATIAGTAGVEGFVTGAGAKGLDSPAGLFFANGSLLVTSALNFYDPRGAIMRLTLR